MGHHLGKLEVLSLTKRFGRTTALGGISLSFTPSTITAVIGPNGAGKTVLLDILSGLRRPTSGHVTLSGEDVTGYPPSRRARLGITRSFQAARVFHSFTFGQHALFSRWLARLHDDQESELASGPGQSTALMAQRLMDGLSADLVSTPMGELSYGTQRMLGLIACALSSPKVWLVDEPSAALDDVNLSRVKVLLLTARERGSTVIVAEHDLRLVHELADVVVQLDAGEVISVGAPRDQVGKPSIND